MPVYAVHVTSFYCEDRKQMHFCGIHKHFTSHSHADFDIDVFVHSTIRVTAYSVNYISS